MKNVVDKLKLGETVTFRPRGNSMSPKIKDKEEVTVIPVKKELNTGDVVLCKVKGRYLLHLIRSVKILKNGKKRFLICNNRGKINGWIGLNAIFGVKNNVKKE